MTAKERISELVDSKGEVFQTVSDKIWEYAELGMKEFKSAKAIIEVLETEGFKIESGLAGIPTAFCGTYGSGKPVIGILGEYDALPNLSQEACCTEQRPIEEDGNGHGCGHNALGAGSLAGIVALKDYMTENNLSGTIKYFGCPGEEFGCGKAFMARDGVFDDLDCALTWHPGASNMTWTFSSLANISVFFSFSGKTAHAAAAPHMGRSALDAAELMNVGVNFLREHIIQEARVHYAFHDVGGQAPNVVQDRAKLHYYIRAPRQEQAREIFERISKIAQGAAMMTETECTIKFKDGLSDYIPNQTITQVMNDAMLEIGPIPFVDDDYALAQRFVEVQPKESSMIMPGMEGKALIAEISPYQPIKMTMPGSTDVGDVSYVTPAAQLMTACASPTAGAHTWQMTAQMCSPLAHKGLLFAGKALALTAVKLIEDPSILQAAREEFDKATGGKKYKALFPDDIMPTLD